MTRERQRLLRAWGDWVNCNPREMLTKVLPAIILKNKACSQMPWTVSSQARQTNDCFRANSDLPFLLDPFQRVCNGEKTDLLFKSCTFPDSVNVPVKESMEVGDELGDRYWNQKTQIWTQQSLNLIPSDYEVSEGVKEEGSSVCRFQCLSDNRAVGRAQPPGLPSTKTLLSQAPLPHLQGQSSPEVGPFHYFLLRAPPCQESQLSLSPRQVHAKFWDSPVLPLAQDFLHQRRCALGNSICSHFSGFQGLYKLILQCPDLFLTEPVNWGGRAIYPLVLFPNKRNERRNSYNIPWAHIPKPCGVVVVHGDYSIHVSCCLNTLLLIAQTRHL